MHMTPLGFIGLRDAINEIGAQCVDDWQGDEPIRWQQSDDRFAYTKFNGVKKAFQEFVANETKKKLAQYKVRIAPPFAIRTAAEKPEGEVDEFALIKSIWTLLVQKYPELKFVTPESMNEGGVKYDETWPLSSTDVEYLLSIPEMNDLNWILEQCRSSLRLLTAWNIFRQKAEAGQIGCIMVVSGDQKDIRPGYWAGHNCEYPDHLHDVDASEAWIKGDVKGTLYVGLERCRALAFVNVEELEAETSVSRSMAWRTRVGTHNQYAMRAAM